jgi:ATP-dependent helicase/DNAse subunit B
MTIKPTTEIPSKYNGKTIYSFSRLQSYHNCEYGFFLNYKLHKDGVQNMYSLLGGVVHENMEKLVYNQMTNEEALKIFREKLFEYTEILNYKFPSPKIQQNFVECVENYIKLYSPIPHKEFYSELEFYTDINGIPLHGFIDGVVFKENDKVVVIDYKTSTKFTKKDLQEKGLQLAL